jgi:hypothetical protein
VNKVVVSCIGSGGVVSAPRVPEKGFTRFFGSGFLGLFDLLFRSDFGALLLAAILSELPVPGSQEVLGMLLTICGFPIVMAQLTFDDNLLTLLAREAKLSPDLPHTLTSTKVVTCWRSPSPSLKNSLLAIVAEATGVPELVSLKVGLATRLPLMMMRLMFIVICD